MVGVERISRSTLRRARVMGSTVAEIDAIFEIASSGQRGLPILGSVKTEVTDRTKDAIFEKVLPSSQAAADELAGLLLAMQVPCCDFLPLTTWVRLANENGYGLPAVGDLEGVRVDQLPAEAVPGQGAQGSAPA